jgi:uncharacterized protein (DUF433 family)
MMVGINPVKSLENMKEQNLLNRISASPRVMVGKPVIRGTRLSVEYILNLLAHGATVTEILEEYEGLVEADIRACLLFASRALESASFMPLAEIA